MKRFIWIVIGMICATTCFGQQNKMKVVIQTSIAEGVPKQVGDLMMDALKEGLTNTGKYTVLESREVIAQKQAEEAGFQQQGFTEGEGVLELGKLMNADFGCYAKIILFNGNYRISLTMTDIKTTGEIIGNFSVTTKNGDNDIFEKCDEIVQQIISKKSLAKKPDTDIFCSKCCWDGSLFVDGYVFYMDEQPTTWGEANRICKEKGNGDGWYLPTKNELLQIYKNRSTLVENGSKPFQRAKYWSSTINNRFTSYYVDFQNGSNDYDSNNSEFCYRCIRTKD